MVPGFFLGGFECSTHRRHDRRRLDLVAATRHDVLAGADYAGLAEHGLRGARDGVRWHLVERSPGLYDWSGVLPVMRAARAAGVRVIWDLSHYGYPDFLDPWEDGFAAALSRYAAAFARLALEEEGRPPTICPVNEISFWAWAGGEVGYINPFSKGRGGALKRRLVAASLAAARAARAAVPGTRVVAVDPIIRVTPRRPGDRAYAERFTALQWEAWDSLLGRQAPELGGGPDGFDLMGVNYYWNNQWDAKGDKIPAGDPLHIPLRHLLTDAWERYRLPLFVAETSIEAEARPAWLRHVGEEVRAAMRAGVPVQGLCLYPVLSHPGWDNDRYCPNGLFEMDAPGGRRRIHAPLAAELRRQQALFAAQLRGEAVAEEPDALDALAAILRRTHDAGEPGAMGEDAEERLPSPSAG